MVLGPIGKLVKVGLTRLGYQIYRPTTFETDLLRNVWTDWFSKDPARFAHVYSENRAALASVKDWIPRSVMSQSLWRYGVPEFWEDSHSDALTCSGVNDVDLEVTTSDLIAFLGSSFGSGVDYLEIGVSLGKTFLQMSRHFRSGEVVGLDVEDISPALRNQFVSDERTWQSCKTYEVQTLSGRLQRIRFSHLRLDRGEGAHPATYVKADQFSPDAWASLKGRKFNLVFSDGVHSPAALTRELDFLLANGLLADSTPFAMIWDDLVNSPMQEAFVCSAEKLKAHFGAGTFSLYRLHGSYGNERLNGVFWA